MSRQQGSLVALFEEDGRVHLVPLEPGSRKVRGIGVFDPLAVLAEAVDGQLIEIGAKRFTVLSPRLPELRAGMRRRAQLVTPKDAGMLLAWTGVGPGDVVLEAGLGSGGLAQQLLRVLGPTGLLISVEARPEHAEVAIENIARMRATLSDVAPHELIDGTLPEAIPAVAEVAPVVDVVLLDLLGADACVAPLAALLRPGGWLACYCPVTSQLEAAWDAAKTAGLTVDWAGELVERRWGRAKLGGVRPVNGPLGHTAFLLLTQRRGSTVPA